MNLSSKPQKFLTTILTNNQNCTNTRVALINQYPVLNLDHKNTICLWRLIICNLLKIVPTPSQSAKNIKFCMLNACILNLSYEQGRKYYKRQLDRLNEPKNGLVTKGTRIMPYCKKLF